VALLGNSNNLGSNRRQVARVALGKSAQISVDSANRILIPVNLLDDAKIVKDVVIAGMGDSIEL
jgi:DNA-binding transcriptional regulator/RsmH inhibitor MraZ